MGAAFAPRAALTAAITLARTSAYMPGEYFTEICREQTHPHFESEEEANAPQEHHHHPFISHKGKTSAKRACETIEVTWHMNMFDMDEICGGECPDEVAAPHHFFYDHKLSSLKIDAQHYRLERDLAQLLGDEPSEKLLDDLAGKADLALALELYTHYAGDHKQVGIHHFLEMARKGKTQHLFEQAHAEDVAVSDLVSRDLKKQRKKKRAYEKELKRRRRRDRHQRAKDGL